MPAINRTLSCSQSSILTKPPPPPRIFSAQPRRHPLTTTTSRSRSSQFRRTDFQSAGFSAPYEPGRPTEGPLSQASVHGAPRLTPSALKEHLDRYVVGQEKAKKITSVAIYNHYQRIRELRRREAEDEERREQKARWELRERERNSHPVENEFPGHVETVDLNPRARSAHYEEAEPDLGAKPLDDPGPGTVIEKSNLLLLGPSGVGKTYILSTLARVLEVPFATVDCSSLTQAGYIGTDIESSIERLLLASNHSIQKCETGIIFFDEVDKLAKPAVMTHGRDVSGEGVQQGLLKMIEGTTVTVNAKSDRSSKFENARGSDRLERGGREGGVGQQQGKSEQYTIDTSNILFVFAGAFVGLERIINSRLSSGSSLGFGAELKTSPLPSSASSRKTKKSPKQSNPLDYVTPHDLQTYGLIPELLGRIPILCSLTPLSLSQLVSILTSPRNSLVAQFTALFSTYGIQLRFTTAALHAIAERALPATESDGKGKNSSGGGIGARGLRSVMESILAEIMFWGPGSAIRYCLVDESFTRSHLCSHTPSSTSSLPPSSAYSTTLKTTYPLAAAEDEDGDDDKPKMPRCWSRGQSRIFEDEYEKEEEAWRARHRNGEGEDHCDDATFERLRKVGCSGM